MEAPNSCNAGKSCINKVQILREEENMKRWLGRKSFLAVLVALLLVLGWADTALALRDPQGAGYLHDHG
ncbi:hypothetical protein HKBW3S06_00598 [Candidatus Hakubella thermalkaliphila]|uniref:Uncharacterized protein n=1 Tax=Candidatus Hakubella thermalkaliphila TaxID=2754717 RepID=A0A6V8NM34_9ACTN|nr:hypothetical protein HKBW3S06_00598 [Candidatus Hakubella thermalkaliphila]